MKRYPSPFIIGDRFHFTNKHGTVTLEAVTESQPVNTIYLKDAPTSCRISWDELEQIALITDQVRLQPVCGDNLKARCSAFIRHDTTSTAGWVKVVELKYNTDRLARDVIASDLASGRNRILI